MNSVSRNHARAALAVLAGAVLISFAAVFVRLTDMPATGSAFYRMLFGSLTLAALLAARPELRAGWRSNWSGSALIALFFAADLWFWHRSIGYIGPGLSTLLANFQVFVLTLVGVVWMRERFGWRFACGLTLAMGGLWLLFGRDWAGLPPDYRLGIILGLLTALAYAGYLLSLRGLQILHRGIGAEARLFQVCVLCTAMLGVVNLFEGNGFAIPDHASLFSLIALGLFCQVLGWLLITRGMPAIPAGLVGLLLLAQPTGAVIWDLLLFGLRLDGLQQLGTLLALIGIYLGFRAAVRRGRADGR